MSNTPFQDLLIEDPTSSTSDAPKTPVNIYEQLITQNHTREQILDEEYVDDDLSPVKDVSGGQIAGSIVTEVGVGIASEAVAAKAGITAGATTTAALAATGVGALIALPAGAVVGGIVYFGTKFTMGYGASVAAQKLIEQQDDISQGRALIAGAANLIPGGKTIQGGSKAIKYGTIGLREGGKGAAIGVADVTARATIDEGRLPTLEELRFGATVGGATGGGLMVGGSALKDAGAFAAISKQTKTLWGKMSGKNAEEIDAMLKGKEIYQEEFTDMLREMDDVAKGKPAGRPWQKDTFKKDFDDAVEQKRLNEQEVADAALQGKQGSLLLLNKNFKEMTVDELSKYDTDDLRQIGDKLDEIPEIAAAEKQIETETPTWKDAENQKDWTKEEGFSESWQQRRGWSDQVDTLYGSGAAIQEKQAIIIAGGSASGKSGIADQLSAEGGYKIIDSDFAKELIPEYQGGKGANVVHAESKEINELVIDRALDNGDNIILPVVGSSGSSVSQRIKDLKDAGYKVAFMYVDIPADLAQVRNLKRYNRTGRFVPPSYIRSSYGAIKNNIKTGQRAADEYQILTNENNYVQVKESSKGFNKLVRGDDVDGGRNRIESDYQADGGTKSRPGREEIHEAIDETKKLLKHRDEGKGAEVTRYVKGLYRKVARNFMSDATDLFKKGDITLARTLYQQLDDYIKFDNLISRKDYADGSSLAANKLNADSHTYQSGITTDGNRRTQDLLEFKEMLRQYIDDPVGAKLNQELGENVTEEARKRSGGVAKSRAERLDEMQAHFSKSMVKKRQGALQNVIDTYFATRMSQMLNQTKTAFVGVPSAAAMSIIRPVINTPYALRQAIGQKNLGLQKKAIYAMSELIATQEYIHMITRHGFQVGRSVLNTIKNKGESSFLYRDRHSYKVNEIADANELSHTAKTRMREAERRVDAKNARGAMKTVMNLRKNIMNAPITKVPMFLFDYGLSLIGGLEEISLIAHSLRKARAEGIRKGVTSGREDWNKAAEEYVESTIDRSSGRMQAKYDPEFKEIFNEARRNHFRNMDLDPNDIRRDVVDGAVESLNKLSNSPNEAGLIARFLFPFIGVPFRALGMTTDYIAPLKAASMGMEKVGRGISKLEGRGGKGTVSSFTGKYNKRIGDLQQEIADETKNLKSADPSTARAAKQNIARAKNDLKNVKDLQMQKDYEDLGILAIGTGMFALGYQMAEQGQITGTDAWMNKDQKRAASNVQGAPKSYKMFFGEGSYDFKYLDPVKGALALGADYYRWKQTLDGDPFEAKNAMELARFTTAFASSIFVEMPTSRGGKALMNVFSNVESVRERGVGEILGSTVPFPAEIRRAQTFTNEFVDDPLQGNPFQNSIMRSLGQTAENYRLTVLGEPKKRDEQTVSSYVTPFGKQIPVQREAIDDVLLEDAYSYNTVAPIQPTFNGIKTKEFVNEDGLTLYSVYGAQMSTMKVGGRTLRQRLNKLVKQTAFVTAYNRGYYDDPNSGTKVNDGIQMIKDIISEHRKAAREYILYNPKAKASLQGFVNDDGQSIYSTINMRKATGGEKTQNLLEELSIPGN
tara:strand:+ start:7548 stop:12230 length:4683 start_codon:yes stop_codon:yes gene_type:complete